MFKITRLIKPHYHLLSQQIVRVSNTAGGRFKGKVAVLTASTNG